MVRLLLRTALIAAAALFYLASVEYAARVEARRAAVPLRIEAPAVARGPRPWVCRACDCGCRSHRPCSCVLATGPGR